MQIRKHLKDMISKTVNRPSNRVIPVLLVCLILSVVSCVLTDEKEDWEEFEGECRFPPLNEIETEDFSAEEKEAFDAIDRLFAWYLEQKTKGPDPQAIQVFPRMESIVERGDAAVQPLLDIVRMGNRHPIEQIWARSEVHCYVMSAMMLGRLEAEEAVDELIIMAARPGHREARLRAPAIKALGEIGGPSAIPVVRRGMDDHFESVRQAAKEAYERLRRRSTEQAKTKRQPTAMEHKTNN